MAEDAGVAGAADGTGVADGDGDGDADCDGMADGTASAALAGVAEASRPMVSARDAATVRGVPAQRRRRKDSGTEDSWYWWESGRTKVASPESTHRTSGAARVRWRDS
ncbi:hypothetical protein [Rathayibacter sp. VKM Ac-2760]|uniref:hypothetical protein n=1 Tax=Rathayibacter sp. VKM Ac-2760 TaxID=2609253 RepID=UPI001315C248|nr:hypothetical protein [Rathayibacter sp. VKM Ac-2760]QHC57490.1 hypothetical protein GSU72_02015 [Rathayibacter sp. VKM Ac-2760]